MVMEEVLSEIINRGETPTRVDIANLLETCGEPGKKREEKIAAVKQLFQEMGLPGENPQGFTLWDDLNDYEQF